MEVRVAAPPVVDPFRRLDIPRGGPTLLVPPLRVTDDQVGSELIHEQQRRELRQQRHSTVERVDMVKHPRGDDGVPPLRRQRRRNLLKLAPQIAVPSRRSRIDAHHVVPAPGELRNEPSLIAAAHLEDAGRRGR
jgi:hypothetical protein